LLGCARHHASPNQPEDNNPTTATAEADRAASETGCTGAKACNTAGAAAITRWDHYKFKWTWDYYADQWKGNYTHDNRARDFDPTEWEGNFDHGKWTWNSGANERKKNSNPGERARHNDKRNDWTWRECTTHCNDTWREHDRRARFARPHNNPHRKRCDDQPKRARREACRNKSVQRPRGKHEPE
jgi:hypothetical protein